MSEIRRREKAAIYVGGGFVQLIIVWVLVAAMRSEGLLAAPSAGVVAQEQAAKPIDYETYCKLPDAESKRAAFRATTAESRGVLVRTQLERWRDANLARLDEKQKAALAELIKSITADSYADGPQGEEARVKSRAIIADVERLFTREDMNAMQPNAPCIPKK